MTRDNFGKSSVAGPLAGPILLFDGSCGLCGAAVRFVLKWDRRQVFRFASLSSPAGKALLVPFALPPNVDSIVVVYQGKALIKSDAILAIVRLLGGMWHLLRVGSLVPRGWRDQVYDFVARRRARWSERFHLGCLLPTPEIRSRFLPD